MAWREHPILQEVLKRERIEKPYVKKDGTISSKPRIFFECYVCKCEWPRKHITIDHIDPIGPTPGSKLAPPELDWNTFIDRMFCPIENLGTVCDGCHGDKSQRENLARRAAMKEIDDASEPQAS